MADFNMAANMYGMYPNLYHNQVALNDLTGLDLYNPYAMMNPYMMNPMMSMNGSVFGSGMAGGCMPYPMMGGSYEDYYKNYDKYQEFMVDNQVKQQQRMRNADLKINAPEEGIRKQAALLHDKILRNEQQQIPLAYEEFKNSVRAMYGEASEDQIANRASAVYSNLVGKSVIEDIRENGRGSFTQGFLQTLTLGVADKKTAEENISQLTGQPVGRSEKAKKIAGNVVGGAVIGGGIALTSKYLLKAFWAGAKNKTFWAALIGGVAGVATAIATAK